MSALRSRSGGPGLGIVRPAPLRVALTGGMAAGKSTVAGFLLGFGVPVIDLDLVAREVVAPGSVGLDSVVAAFGSGVLSDDGGLDRAALAALVFADDAARRVLESITHPLIRSRELELVAAAVAAGAGVVVTDIPLLVESGRVEDYDLVVTVAAPEAIRLRRAVQERDLSVGGAQARLSAQATDAERAAVADHVLDGSGAVDMLKVQVAELVESWTSQIQAATSR